MLRERKTEKYIVSGLNSFYQSRLCFELNTVASFFGSSLMLLHFIM